MKPGALLINTSRGGIVNEADLAEALRSGHLGGAAIDVFEHEPYSGELTRIESCLLTSHMGSMSVDCRARLEIEATEEAVRFLGGQALRSPVPPEEYEVQRQGL
jgi:D-3-phosphoglycerate dehydrogenase